MLSTEYDKSFTKRWCVYLQTWKNTITHDWMICIHFKIFSLFGSCHVQWKSYLAGKTFVNVVEIFQVKTQLYSVDECKWVCFCENIEPESGIVFMWVQQCREQKEKPATSGSGVPHSSEVTFPVSRRLRGKVQDLWLGRPRLSYSRIVFFLLLSCFRFLSILFFSALFFLLLFFFFHFFRSSAASPWFFRTHGLVILFPVVFFLYFTVRQCLPHIWDSLVSWCTSSQLITLVQSTPICLIYTASLQIVMKFVVFISDRVRTQSWFDLDIKSKFLEFHSITNRCRFFLISNCVFFFFLLQIRISYRMWTSNSKDSHGKRTNHSKYSLYSN